uniref:K Homology domain-containing protein n=1 Tax=Kalanchoe fedtschenkoi TaxID=63787 RepID=A0A7N0VH52_KALFE
MAAAAAAAAAATTHGADNSSSSQNQPTSSAAADANKWPGWPGYCVFRIIVPVTKVGTIIGRKGDLIRKLCEDTRARVRVLDPPPIPTSDRIVLIYGKEELEAHLSPAMDAVMRVFKRINGLENEDDSNVTEMLGSGHCSVRLLVASAQAVSLIGKQGSVIKSIQESTGSAVRVLSEGEIPLYIANGERIVELQGEGSKVHKALDAVVGHLRKFLVDHSVIPLFEKSFKTPNVQERQLDMWTANPLLHAASQSGVSAEHSMLAQRYLERDGQVEIRFPASGASLYEPDFGIPSIRSAGNVLGGSSMVTQITKTMQIPLSYAEDIIGIAGTNIAYIRRTSGAVLTVQESKGLPEEITVEIKGTSSQVQIAQRLIQDFISNHKQPVVSDYGNLEMGSRSSSLLQHNNSHLPSSLMEPYGGYSLPGIPGRPGSTGVGDFSNTFRL